MWYGAVLAVRVTRTGAAGCYLPGKLISLRRFQFMFPAAFSCRRLVIFPNSWQLEAKSPRTNDSIHQHAQPAAKPRDLNSQLSNLNSI